MEEGFAILVSLVVVVVYPTISPELQGGICGGGICGGSICVQP
jgi:hypothetical protein